MPSSPAAWRSVHARSVTRSARYTPKVSEAKLSGSLSEELVAAAEGHALVVDDLRGVLDELPSHLVVGTGAQGRMRPDPGTIHQPASTAAALHLTC
jgi:hypothetical protein